MKNRLAHGLLITGTDTDVGKTIVTAGLLRAFQTRGISSTAVKPIQTGCFERDGKTVVPDLAQYARATADLSINANDIQIDEARNTTYCYAPACSPHLAAAEAGESIELGPIVEMVESYRRRLVLTLVEGAGGIEVPLGDGRTMLDLFRELDLPVVLVVANRLGAINHGLLSIRRLRDAGLSLAALVFNETSPAKTERQRAIRADNIKTITEYGQVRDWVELPYQADQDFSTGSSWSTVAERLGPIADQLITDCPFSSETPDADLSDRKKFDRDHIWHPYTSAINPPQTWEVASAAGTTIRLTDGRELVDGMASWWCAIHGYRNAKLDRAIRDQLDNMAHVMFGGLTHQPAIELGRDLLEIVPQGLDQIFYADSGSVAVEVALKMALQYAQATGQSQRRRILTVRGGYHGDTTGAMSVSDPEAGMHTLFRDHLAKAVFVERPSCRFDEPFDPDSLDPMRDALNRHGESLAAVILEPIVQGAGGFWFYHSDYLRGLRRMCDEHGVLLIFDEIATGFGRTGRMFAADWADVTPDILCLGKALTGGYMTLAATLATRNVADGVSCGSLPLMHGPTFMANPTACAVARASLAILKQNDWPTQVASIESTLKESLEPCRNFDSVADVRVLGAIGVVELKSPVDVPRLQAFFVDQGVWIRPYSKWIYLMPPYTITTPHLLKLSDTLRAGLAL
jgi:adenosylmethionine---8-amino-7-oxononanoate aminotransferase